MANETDLPDFDDVEMESPMEEVHADPRDEEIIVLKEEAAAFKDRLLRLAAPAPGGHIVRTLAWIWPIALFLRRPEPFPEPGP